MTAPAPVALVTGAARRLGRAIACGLHAAGYRIGLHFHRSAEEAASLQAELEQHRRGSCLLLQADLRDSGQLAPMVERCVQHFGRLDALVNNASTFIPSPLEHSDPALWDELMQVNARAPFFLAQAAADALRQSRGAILNLADIYAERPLPQHAIYCMSKAALSMLTLALARDLAPQVRVNAIAPGAILWPETVAEIDAETQAGRHALLERTALKRSGSPEEIAEAAVFLLKHASYCSGQILRVDGGRWLSI